MNGASCMVVDGNETCGDEDSVYGELQCCIPKAYIIKVWIN